MRRVVILLLLLAIVAGGAYGAWWYYTHREQQPKELLLYGNVDLRQVQLAFNNSERIAAVLAQEGDHVEQGQVLARLDTRRLEPQVAQAEAQLAMQQHVVEKMHAGSRPEEIAQAKANVASAQAEVANGRQQYERLKKLAVVKLNNQTEVRAVSQ
ncbi:MAG TPA: biotin/lipoyl-binding protein, partial [Gemmataceae bacterium]|nr:biotin/lipoyl-binding protein [Gemmataceae bacterium]